MKVLECSQHYTFIFQTLKAANSVVDDGIWQKCKLTQAFMVVLVTCNNDKDSFKNESPECSQHFSLYKSVAIFSDDQGQLTP